VLAVSEDPFQRRKGICNSARARPRAPCKVLELEMFCQGHLKLLENENFSLEIDRTS